MFASLVGLIHQPSIAIRVPNDDSTFNPKEYPSLSFIATGKVQGKIRLIHGTEDDSNLAMISTRIWVTKENDKDEVAIKLSFDNKTHVFTLEGPTRFGSFNIYHETTIQIPRSFQHLGSLRLKAPNTSFSAEGLDHLLWTSVQTELSNAAIALQYLAAADSIALRTSNSSISGVFSAGHIDLTTSNGSISAKLRVEDAQDGRQSIVMTKTSNASIHLHVDATTTRQGIWMENTTKNGKIVIGTLLGPSEKSSNISTTTSNSKIEFNLDASQTGQALEVTNKTSNASILSSIMVPPSQFVKCLAQSADGSVTVNLTDDFKGWFDLETSNSSTTVEGSHLMFETEKKNTKRGYHDQGESQVKLLTSNSSAKLNFYSAGASLAADVLAKHEYL
ncbi:hypothetical protein BX616_001594 [Lobosporangium transversale]|uniref:Uncharacterized protein n=1 Tax=Lobosporangium transversale TaxID=64571 RepID=A0A1Y2GT76_9FUNG|nr:hypothetical protein BCR41DRAFT_349498 [Lobosporangium transversale]KAF9903548.1 hypothetical protein BX616_001594 [Lobosporangium transversale]ORZ22701.1 hypothetical protein BCR41DRAFT_349498 [Lobosporangium transversale]|eukprot:XP_021883255.1 hypothetical protein BCR41DRAFT_349498 [Lobosporangium transversale]